MEYQDGAHAATNSPSTGSSGWVRYLGEAEWQTIRSK